MINDKDINSYNEIDLECNITEDDDSFGGNKLKENFETPKVISGDFRDQGLVISKNFTSNLDNDYGNYNQIDLDCNISEDFEDDDDLLSFENPQTKDRNTVKTNIILDFSDEDDLDEFSTTSIKNNLTVEIPKNLEELAEAYNVDCTLVQENSYKFSITNEDENYEYLITDLRNSNPKSIILNRQNIIIVIDSETLLEKKNKKNRLTNSGIPTKSYLKDLAKNHTKTNVKGARGGAEVFPAGDPEKNMQAFNHMMGTDLVGSVGAGDAGGSEGSTEGGMCEQVKNTYTKLYEDILNITGFALIKNKDNTYNLKDTLQNSPEIKCKNKCDVISKLTPYIEDCFITPLQITTGKDFNSYSAWCDWYSDNNNQKQYPQIKQDIQYCDLLANHLNDVE